MSSQHSMSTRRVAKRRLRRIRLICFGGAGSGASYFRDWQASAPPEIEICAVQLPGRRGRINGRQIEGFGRLIPQIAGRLRELSDTPFAFFGHSLGALISFEVARYLQRHHDILPQHLYVSACRAPHVPPLRPAISHLSNREFIDEIRRNYDFPEALSEDTEIIELALPTLLADFRLFEGYTYLAGPPLTCGITVFLGDNDRSVSRTALYAWKEQTQSSFDLHSLRGNHILSSEEKRQILIAITNAFRASAFSSKQSSVKGERTSRRRGEGRVEVFPRRERISQQCKVAAVMRLLRGEDLEAISRSLGTTAATVATWRDAFLAAGEAVLSDRPRRGRGTGERALECIVSGDH